MAFKFKTVYTENKDSIPSAINEGIINPGDLIIVNNKNGTFNICFTDPKNEILEASALTNLSQEDFEKLSDEIKQNIIQEIAPESLSEDEILKILD